MLFRSGRIRLGPHPTDMVISAYKPQRDPGEPPVPWQYRLFVAAANTNNVFAVAIGQNQTMNLADNIHVAPSPLSPLGMTPSALALSPDQTRLYVACSDADVVASVNVSDVRGVVEGFIPAGAYPAAVRAAKEQVWVASARGNTVQPLGEIAPFPPAKERPRLPSAAHVIYVIRETAPEAVMRAVAGIAPDFTVKLGRLTNFDAGDPANLPPAGYLWTNAIAAGITVRNYGVLARNGQAMDPAMRPFTKPDAAAFLEDLKQFETSGMMPRLIFIADPTGGESVKAAIARSRFASDTQVVLGDLARAEALLGLRPMTLKD